MHKSGWAVAATLGSLALLLAGCGGSSSSSSGGGSATNPGAAGQPTSAIGQFSPGDTVFIVQRSALGYVMAMANGLVVYTYGNDKAGGQPTCTSSCASLWPGVTGIPMTNAGEKLPGQFGTITLPNGAKQITYNGLPLYYLKSERPLSTAGNGKDGLWHVIHLSKSDILLGG